MTEGTVEGPTRQVETGLDELRTHVLGAEILLGFQYQSVFQTGFAALPNGLRVLDLIAFALLILVVVALIAPGSHHRIAERGEATTRQRRFTDQMTALALGPFAIATGANVTVVTGRACGGAASVALGALACALALLSWYGIEIMTQRKGDVAASRGERTPLAGKIKELMTEARLILPGVQALLGFQLAAFLTETFAKLTAIDKACHLAGLLLLVLSMILLMTPAAYHRLAEHGEASARLDRIGVGCLLSAMAALAMAVASDFFVALDLLSGEPRLATAGGLAAALVAGALWFALPIARRARG